MFPQLVPLCILVLLFTAQTYVLTLFYYQKCYMLKLKSLSSGFTACRSLNEGSYILYDAAGLDAITESHPLLVVCVFPRAEDVLETLVVGSLIDHPHTALHPDGVAAAEICVQVRAVAAAVIAAALEFLLLIKCDLW